MKIKKSYSLQDLQKQFSNEFPGLKIEFFRPVYAGYEGPYDLLHYSNTTKLSAISPDVKSIEFELDDTEEVGQFEARFSKLIGVDVQVFRRSKELWLQTTKTDKWTLNRQNLKGLHSLN
tara:strand:- start:519 stop:875 length:357 start_codon:yes stop_codon:yes gene_type:complete